MPTIQYPKNPNTDTAFVVQDDGTKNRALMTAPQDTSTLELPSNPNSTKGYVTVDGKKQRVILTADIGGSGGGDQHNLGYYATLEALEEAHPTAEAGDYAIVGSTDTVWLWDEDTSAWVDSDTKGQVISVNSKTGTVVLTAEDVGALPQYSTMPVASSSNSGLVVQYTGTTNANYTHGYLYKCVSGFEYMGGLEGNDMLLSVDNQKLTEFLNAHNYSTSSGTTFNLTVEADPDTGDAIYVVENYDADVREEYLDLSVMKTATGIDWTPYPDETPSPTDPNAVGATSSNTTEFTVGSIYDWKQTDVQPAPVIPDPLPSQTGNAGKFLTTDGTDASWSDKPLVNKGTVASNLNILGWGSTAAVDKSGATSIGYYAAAKGGESTAVGSNASTGVNKRYAVSIGASSFCDGTYSVAIGGYACAMADGAIQLGSLANGRDTTNTDVNTFKVANANGNFEIMSADGTVPTARLTKVNTTATLAVADWSSNTQTVSISGITADGVVFVSPTPASQVDYTSAGVICSAQAAGTLTFTCDTVPSNDISVTVVML